MYNSFRSSEDTLKLLNSVSKHLSMPEELDEVNYFYCERALMIKSHFFIQQVSRILATREAMGKKLDTSITESILNTIRSNIRWVDNRSEEFYQIMESKQSK